MSYLRDLYQLLWKSSSHPLRWLVGVQESKTAHMINELLPLPLFHETHLSPFIRWTCSKPTVAEVGTLNLLEIRPTRQRDSYLKLS